MTTDPFAELAAARSRGVARGLYSVCSAHPLVLEAAVRRAARRGLPVLVEATANQVNQSGGYTGLRPADFASQLNALRERCGVSDELVVFGGDHLGPYPWRGLPAERAMQEAETLVRAFVAADARKIHLDASMALGGDPPGGVSPRLAAERAVRLCAAAEDEHRRTAVQGQSALPPVYVIGTEVPTPGGLQASGEKGPAPTSGRAFAETLGLHRELFLDAGLAEAWGRVIAVVVQPGVEFDSRGVSPYRRERASELSRALGGADGRTFEAHSTDYQSDDALRALVEDGFAILKVGPALTFALREALLGLSEIETRLNRGPRHGGLAETLRHVMQKDARYWEGYYQPGDELALLYSPSDRVRYYWEKQEVSAEVTRLLDSLSHADLPPGLLSQFLPRLGGPQAALCLAPDARPRGLVLAAVDAELARYESACFPQADSDTGSIDVRGTRKERVNA